MAMPDFQTLMRPLLELAQDGEEHTLTDARERLAEKFKLTEEDRKALLPERSNSKVHQSRCLGEGVPEPSRRFGSAAARPFPDHATWARAFGVSAAANYDPRTPAVPGICGFQSSEATQGPRYCGS